MSSLPVSLGPIDSEMMEGLRSVVPADFYWQYDYHPDQLTSEFPAHPSREMYELISPMAQKAIADFTELHDGVGPTEVRLDVGHSVKQRSKIEKWHQILLFPGSYLYEANACNPVEFAVGEVPGLAFMPNSLLNGLTWSLVKAGKLEIARLDANTLIRTDSYAIRRQKSVASIGEVSISLDVFNGYHSVSLLNNSLSEKLRTNLLARR